MRFFLTGATGFLGEYLLRDLLERGHEVWCLYRHSAKRLDELLRTQGFFFGGLAPRWFGADGVMMQQLFDSEPDYEETKLYSQEAKDLMAFIRADKAALAAEMGRRQEN